MLELSLQQPPINRVLCNRQDTYNLNVSKGRLGRALATKRGESEVDSIDDDQSEHRQRSKRYRPLPASLSKKSKRFKWASYRIRT
jgi:hypothetical protein